MNIHTKVFSRAKKNEVKQDGEIYKVYVTAPAVEGRANKAVIGLLAEYFGVKKNQIEIIKGLKYAKKTINIYNLK